MTKWKTILCCGALLSGLSGCEDTRSDYMEEFQTLVYFRNSGEQTLSLYLTGENTLYDIPICKSGRDLDATATAWIVVMDQAQLDIYNIENLTDYVQLPASCYKFLTPTEFAFTGKDAYQVARVELDTNAVSDLQAQDPSAHYVLALQVYSDRPIGASVNLLMLSLQIDIPQLSLASSGLVKANYTASSPVVNTYQNSVALNIDNSWDFTCPLEVLGQEWLDAYNSENETEYKLLPAGSFTVPTEVTFKAGEKSVPFEISVDRSGLELLEEYLLPVRLAGSRRRSLPLRRRRPSICLMCASIPTRSPCRPTWLRLPIRIQETAVACRPCSTARFRPLPTGIPSTAEVLWAILSGATTSIWHSRNSFRPSICVMQPVPTPTPCRPTCGLV